MAKKAKKAKKASEEDAEAEEGEVVTSSLDSPPGVFAGFSVRAGGIV